MTQNTGHRGCDFLNEKIVLPFPPQDVAEMRTEMDVYARFMRHLRSVPSSREEIRILSSIQFVADMMVLSDALVAKMLVDLGLRAPRMAFPETYLEHADQALMRGVHEIGSANESLRDLKLHWDRIGEDRLAAFRRVYPALTEGLFTSV
ncbi:MAG TPA: hypothetical protein PKI93_05610 [Alphaproteobacteria bacterium]|nr:hypothetical protein [Alphaproteobacteria bacterium]HNS44522.1 hypothetical protein [Alphaproteobacteria bacterium]